MVDKPIPHEHEQTTDAGESPASTPAFGASAPLDDAAAEGLLAAVRNKLKVTLTDDDAQAASLSALGAVAPHDDSADDTDNVVDFAAALRAQQSSSSDVSSSAAAPRSPDKATASRGKGATKAGGGKKGSGGGSKPPPKQPDWGKYNYLIANFSLIYGTDRVWDNFTRLEMKISAMAHAHSTQLVSMWKQSEQRRTILPTDIVFDPTMTCDADRCINLFDGMAHVPEASTDEEVKPMLELLRHLCLDCATEKMSIDEIMRWVLSWLALPLQRPGTKLQTALVFHGAQGTGKNLFFDCIKRIYGRYGAMVGQTELDDKYNTWLSAKMLIIGDEVVSRQELYHQKNKLKWMITSTDPVPIRAMHADTRWETNFINLVFLSNESQPLVIEINDRRFLVVYTPVAADSDLYLRVADFLAAGGEAKFYDYLLRYDVGNFHAHTKPLMTEAKKDLIELSMQPHERFLHEWFSGLLPLPMRVCSAEQLYSAFMRWCDMSGERFRPNRSQFTTKAKRYAREHIERDDKGDLLPDRLVYKHIAVRNAEKQNGRVTMRCWVPRGCGCPSHLREGDWAADCIETFQEALGVFYRTGHAPGRPHGDGE